MRASGVLSIVCLCLSACSVLDGPGGGSPGGGGPGGPTTGPGGDPIRPGLTCKKVDLVISVDNSGSMSEEKSAMANDVFPAFARALKLVGGGLDDYRVGVIDACPAPAVYHTRGMGGDCQFQSGQRWMLSTDPALESEFRCVGDIDSATSQCTGKNDDEQPVSAAAASLEAPARTGGNAGFLRDDGLLVVVAITDEDETPTPVRTPDEVFARLAAVKGDPRRMVLLGIGGAQSCSGVYGDADHAENLRAIADRFGALGRGVFWDLCKGKLEDGLSQAMAVINQACDELPELPIL
jgi:hypothetical protein